jgi:hypothetical protein
MNDFTAAGIAEGFIDPEGDTDEEREASVIAAWQHLINTGLAWRLQGYFGRTAHDLIERGVCQPASSN